MTLRAVAAAARAASRRASRRPRFAEPTRFASSLVSTTDRARDELHLAVLHALDSTQSGVREKNVRL